MVERCEHYGGDPRPGDMGYGRCKAGNPGCTEGRAAEPEACWWYWRARAKKAKADLQLAAAERVRVITLGQEERDRCRAAERELADHRLLVQGEVARLRVLLEEPGEYTGQRLILESVIENLSALAQEGEE